MIASGQIKALDEVKREVTAKDEDAAKWAQTQSGLFVPLTTDIQLATKQVMAAHANLLGSAVGCATVPTRSRSSWPSRGAGRS
jgi:hypothetical protein